MRGVNKVTLIGNCGNDPELKYTQGGLAICSLSIATTDSRKDRDGNRVEKTAWHRVKFFGKLAEIAGEYLRKGSQCYVEGRIEYGSYEKDGQKVYTTDIIADEMQMLGGKSEGAASSSGSRGNASKSERPTRQSAPVDDFQDSDIPF